MVQYTLAQSPEVVLNVPGKDSAKAREKAMSQLIELMDAGKLTTDLAEGFSPQQFIEVKEAALLSDEQEDAITQAVQVLNNLATLKIKAQELRSEAMKVRAQVDVLFTDDSVTEEEITQLKEGFKTLKVFAQTNLRYREARTQAENARVVLDQALHSSSHPVTEEVKPAIAPSPEATKPTPEETKSTTPTTNETKPNKSSHKS